jgi:hypothetical protein
MFAMDSRIRISAAIALSLASFQTAAQPPLFDGMGRAGVKTAAVEYLFPEQVTLPANTPSTVTLHFRVAPGLHINSHTPKDSYFIPTEFSIPDGSGVRLEGASYPAGADFTLPLDPDTKLSVYSGEFAIQARMVAAAGNHMVEAKLRYQACDNSACMPPKTITVAMDVVGKQ